MQTYTCKRCGWTWTPRAEHPRYCPACKSPKWQTVSRYGQKTEGKEELFDEGKC